MAHDDPATSGLRSRPPREIFQHHLHALITGNLDEVMADFADDALFVTPAGVWRGKRGVREGYTRLLDEFPARRWEFPTRIFKDDALFVEWRCTDADQQHVTEAVASFVFRDGLIELQTFRRHGVVTQ